MLQKVIIKLKCVVPGTLKGYGGTEIHGWFFNYLKGIEHDLSTLIHAMDEKPFTIGPLYGGKKERGKTIVTEGGEYSFSLASLNKEMFEVLVTVSSDLTGKEIQLGSGKFLVTGVNPIFGEKGLTYFDLLEKRQSSLEINLEFCSPTSFRQQGVQEVFPLPNLVFGSLLRKWNSFSPVILPVELAYSSVFVKKFNLRTELVDFGNYKIIGCVGTCTYQMDKRLMDYQVNIFTTLASFAGISGVGYKTSMGLGDVRYIIVDRR